MFWALQALGYHLYVESSDRTDTNDARRTYHVEIPTHEPSGRTKLTMHGEPLGRQRKYENEGGPQPAKIVNLPLRESDDPEADVGAFVDALGLDWVIGGTDAYAKNYSLLLSPGSIRLAPLYDMISVLPYPHRIHYREAKLTMRIDREYHVRKIRRRHWERASSAVRTRP